jgi:hypothetical protein
MSRHEWLAYVLAGLIAGCVITYWVFPRYETEIPVQHGLGFVVVKTDRWTGRVEWMRVSPEMVRRRPGGVLVNRIDQGEEPDTSFDGDEQRLAGASRGPSTQIIEVPGYGNVEFPASMSDDEIARVIKQFVRR